jgi:hypothetical protein
VLAEILEWGRGEALRACLALARRPTYLSTNTCVGNLKVLMCFACHPRFYANPTAPYIRTQKIRTIILDRSEFTLRAAITLCLTRKSRGVLTWRVSWWRRPLSRASSSPTVCPQGYRGPFLPVLVLPRALAQSVLCNGALKNLSSQNGWLSGAQDLSIAPRKRKRR